jgi:hypothetical protein
MALASCRSELASGRGGVTIRNVFVVSREQRGNMSVIDALGLESADSKLVGPAATGFGVGERGVAHPTAVGLKSQAWMRTHEASSDGSGRVFGFTEDV